MYLPRMHPLARKTYLSDHPIGVEGEVSVQELLERYAAGERDFSGIQIVDADIGGGSLIGARFVGATLKGARLAACDLRAVDFSSADLTNVDFRGANLDGASLTDAAACGARMSNASGRALRFEGARLLNADLERCDLTRASGVGAHLSQATLARANLERTVLDRVNLEKSDLCGTNFRGASLGRSSLKGALLRNTELTGADLKCADVSDAVLGGVVFGRTRLEGVVGLETIRHESPSFLDTATLGMSRGRLPKEFLRGCGLQDWEIELAKLYDSARGEVERTEILYQVFEDLGSQAIQYESVFISHSTADKEFADALFDHLQDAGVRCWYAPRHLKGGRKLYEQIDGAIQVHDRLLLVLSKSSMTSEWVKSEIAEARAKEAVSKQRVLFPIALVPFEDLEGWKLFDSDRGSDSAREIRAFYVPDFSNWKHESAFELGFKQLLRDLVPDRPAKRGKAATSGRGWE